MDPNLSRTRFRNSKAAPPGVWITACLVMSISIAQPVPGQSSAETSASTAVERSPEIKQAPENQQSAPRTAAGAEGQAQTAGRVFISPEGLITNEPAPGQLERLLRLGRQLATQRAALPGGELSTEATPSAEELIRHTSSIFATPVGVGAALDDRFLHSLRVKFSDDGRAVYYCDSDDHKHGHGADGADSTSSESIPTQTSSSAERAIDQ